MGLLVGKEGAISLGTEAALAPGGGEGDAGGEGRECAGVGEGLGEDGEVAEG